MEATELRIGNYIAYNNKNESIGQITALISDYVAGLDYCQIDFVINKKHWIINLHPIPLTEEWLLNFGFEKIGINFQINGISIWFSSYAKSYQLRYCLIGSDFERIINLEYVHQLQNLFFVLTNGKLTLTNFMENKNGQRIIRGISEVHSAELEYKESVSPPERYGCNAGCEDVDYGDCCHPNDCQKRLKAQ